jgi:uncharacterized membrane protein YgcG
VIVGIFKGTEGAGPDSYTARVFNEWKLSRDGNGALIAIYPKDREARLQTGYRLETVQLSREIRSELRSGNTPRAVALATIETLRGLSSPALQDSTAEQLLRLVPQKPSNGFGMAWLLLVVGLALLWVALSWLLAAEAHFTSAGWFRPLPLRDLRQHLQERIRGRGKPPRPKGLIGGTSGSW